MPNPNTVDALTGQPGLQAIITALVPDGEGGYRIIATCDARTETHSWVDNLDVKGNHAHAALSTFKSLGWHRTHSLAMGGTGRDGYAFVQVPLIRAALYNYDLAAKAMQGAVNDLHMLAGDIVGDGAWREIAPRCAQRLRVLACQLDAAAEGHTTGGVTFPSISEAIEGES